LGEEVLSRLRDAYRKIRNTHRFLLGNLIDFDHRQPVIDENLTELDRWALARTGRVARRVREAYRNFEFHLVFHTLYNFCVVDLSNFYFDVLKDRLYVLAPNSLDRRSAQTALFRITDTLVRLFAPILPFTCEEIWKNLYLQGEPVESVHMAEFSQEIDKYQDDELLGRWERLLEIRAKVSKALEESRQQKQIGNSLEAKVGICCGQDLFEYLQFFSKDLRFLFIVSDVELTQSSELSGCERCWTYSPSVGSHSEMPTLCSRCFEILKEIDKGLD
jgi:isoleucyl-tRNA synthetase